MSAESEDTMLLEFAEVAKKLVSVTAYTMRLCDTIKEPRSASGRLERIQQCYTKIERDMLPVTEFFETYALDIEDAVAEKYRNVKASIENSRPFVMDNL